MTKKHEVAGMEFTVADFLALSEVEGTRIVAGAQGVDRVITRTNIMDNPDTFDWLMPENFCSAPVIFLRSRPWSSGRSSAHWQKSTAPGCALRSSAIFLRSHPV